MTQIFESTDASLVLTLEEISNLAAEGGKPADTLANVVVLIAKRFRTDVCSAYLLEPDRSNVVLAATVGMTLARGGLLPVPRDRPVPDPDDLGSLSPAEAADEAAS